MMVDRVDLHFHSTYSDGAESIDGLAGKIRALNLAGVALTDHDTVEGVGALKSALQGCAAVLSGTELSCEWKGREIHLLAYGVDPSNRDFLSALTGYQIRRAERFSEMIRKIQALGFELDELAIQERYAGTVLGRPHVANALIDAGICRSFKEAFDRFIGRGAAAYVPKARFPIEEGIELVHKCGGVAVVAHPGLHGLTEENVRAIAELGLDGIEVIHPKHSTTDRERFERMANALNLLKSGGSDYHGGRLAEEGVPLGTLPVPFEWFEQLVKRVGKEK